MSGYLVSIPDPAEDIIQVADERVQILEEAKRTLPIGWSNEDFATYAFRVLTNGRYLDQADWQQLNVNLGHFPGPSDSFRDYDAYRVLVDALWTAETKLGYSFDKWKMEFVEMQRNIIRIAQGTDQLLVTRAVNIIDDLKDLGFNTDKIANDTSDKLTAFFVDGTYNFTYILFPTAVLQNGFAGTGTCVISSNYNVNTKLLDKKSLINSFLDPQPQTILQSFDINSNSIVMDTYGSSLSGKFGFKEDGSALNTVETGYDATYGTFTTFYRFYIKTQIGFLISNYNKDTDELHSVWFYSIVPKATDATPDVPARD